MSNKSYGSDENGSYITWTTDNEKVIHKKYVSGPLKGEHTGHDSRTNKDFWAGSDYERREDRDSSDSSDSSSSSSSSSGCYIATATLNGHTDISVLDPLKDWRYTVLEKDSLGQRLSNYYRRTAPNIAKKIKGEKEISALLRHMLVFPSVWMATRRKSASITFFYDVILWSAFLTGLATMHVVDFVRNNK